MREHSYRGKDSETGQWVYGDLITIKPPAIIPVLSDYKYPCIWNTTGIWPVDPTTVGQYTGLKDREGRDIYEGDEIQFRRPYRNTQTHTGDNIPNGSYTEPLEPEIATEEVVVSYKDGMFVAEIDLQYGINEVPIAWLIPDYDEEAIQSCISTHRTDWETWDDPDEGDLQYLLEAYKLKDVTELIAYCNEFKVLRSIHDNPELIK